MMMMIIVIVIINNNTVAKKNITRLVRGNFHKVELSYFLET